MTNLIVFLKIFLATTIPFITLNLLQLVIDGHPMVFTWFGAALGFCSGMAVAEHQIFKVRRRRK